MAFIHSISIKNYRGIKDFHQVFNTDTVVLIGRGDSGKSTILNAIQAALTPRWNFSFTDVDFYNCETIEPIEIEVELVELPQELMRDDKFGLYLGILKEDGSVSYNIEDDNNDEKDKPLLRVKLVVNSDLEPKWYVVSKRTNQEDKEISGADRALFNMFMINDYVDNHFSYNRLSPLHRLLWSNIEDKTKIDYLLANIVRKAYSEAKKIPDLSLFNDSIAKIIQEAKSIGLDVSELKTLLEYKENAFTESNFSLHMGDVPYRQFGKGSKRLLSMAIQQTMIADGGIVLIDEVEQGLEPDRVRHITRKLKEHKKGQVFYTTHSRDAIIEPNVTDVYLMKKGEKAMHQLDDNLQGVIRTHPEAFFSRKIIFCEGATEEGILKGIEIEFDQKDNESFPLNGVSIVNSGGGDKFLTNAEKMTDAGYSCLVFCDDDNSSIDRKLSEVEYRGDITVVKCDKGKAIEQQMFLELCDSQVVEILQHLASFTSIDILKNTSLLDIQDFASLDSDKKLQLRILFGERAKTESWYKNVGLGKILGKAWFDSLPDMGDKTLHREYEAIIAWTKQ